MMGGPGGVTVGTITVDCNEFCLCPPDCPGPGAG